MSTAKSVIDQFLDIEDPWSLPVSKQKELLVSSIIEAVEFHYSNNPVWQKLCNSKGFKPGDIHSYEDLNKIPVISTRAFKGGFDLLSVPGKDIVKVHMSSGTSGNRSKVPRDSITLKRNSKSLWNSIKKFRVSEGGYFAMMSPSPDEMGDLTIANYSRTACSLASSYDFFLRLDGGFQPDKVVERINNVTDRPVNIGGAPMLILALAEYILKSGNRITTLTEESGVSSGGGFKTPNGEVIDRKTYNQIVMNAFGIKEANIRDVYSMSELNGAVLECGHHNKHIPPYFYLSIRNPENIEEEVPAGDEGLPVFIDPLAHSYPGFIIADDIVSLTTAPFEKCQCGQVGPTIASTVRRARGAEDKGCGRHVAELKEQLTD